MWKNLTRDTPGQTATQTEDLRECNPNNFIYVRSVSHKNVGKKLQYTLLFTFYIIFTHTSFTKESLVVMKTP